LRRLANASDRWLLRSLPEYHLFADEAARLRAIKELDAEVGESRGFWRGIIVIMAVATLLANGALCIVPAINPWRVGWFGSGGWLAVGFITVATVASIVWLWRCAVARRLRHKLIEQGVPVCRACGYVLRGLAPDRTDRCPECSWPLDDAVRQAMSAHATREER
jgi:hypothetical protein